jgi:hypothetical protein
LLSTICNITEDSQINRKGFILWILGPHILMANINTTAFRSRIDQHIQIHFRDFDDIRVYQQIQAQTKYSALSQRKLQESAYKLRHMCLSVCRKTSNVFRETKRNFY